MRTFEKDPKRQCLISKKQLLENEKWGPPKPKNNNTVINVKDDVDTVPKEEEDSSVALAVSVTISVVLILVIVILLYCLVSKRDLSPCPSKSNFGRRYSNVAESMRRNMRRASTMPRDLWRSMTMDRDDQDYQDDGLLTTASYSNNGISATASAATTPEVKLKFAPPSKSPVLPPRVPLKPPSGTNPTNYSAGGWRQEEMVPKTKVSRPPVLPNKSKSPVPSPKPILKPSDTKVTLTPSPSPSPSPRPILKPSSSNVTISPVHTRDAPPQLPSWARQNR